MSEQPAVVRSGLLTTEAAPVPLTGVSIEAEISSFCARVSVTQRYVNAEPHPIEAVYLFPLDEGAAICGFEAIIDGTLVVGEVKEREEAFRMYDDAMERGHGAFLLDEERPDVFQASVGNLPPGKDVLLKLTYVTELAVERNGLRFAIPTTVSPRYAPVEDQRGVGRPDSQALNPPLAWEVPYGLKLSVRLAMPGAIARVESPSHPVTVTMNGRDATVALSQREAALDRDFVLSVESAGLDAPQAWIEREDDGSQSIAVAFAPKLPETPMPAEVIFLVDRSGSMDGTSIEEVRNALQLCLRSMPAGCRFNIIGFGSSYAALFDESRAYDEQSLAEANRLVASMQADLGGTEILPALEFALKGPRAGSLARQVVVMTDGQVTNTDGVIALARKYAASARIFTFGIGAGSSHHLVKGLARAGGGVAEFIYPRERIEPKVVRLVGRLLSPSLANVRIDWGGLAVRQAPAAVPQVFAAGRLLVYGFGERPIGPSSTVRLTADSPSGALAFEVPVDPARAVAGRTVCTLAARARIRELEESPEWTATRGSRQVHRKPNAVAQEIIALAIKYGLMSRETSYVAIERRDTPVVGDVQLRRVPTMLTDGWGGVGTAAVFRRAAVQPGFGADFTGAYKRLPVPMSSGAEEGLHGPAAPQLGAAPLSSRSTEESFFRVFSRRPRGARAQGSSPAPPREMHALVALQHADGSWDLTAELAGLIGRSLSDLEPALDGASGNPEHTRRAWATALALVWLRTRARDVEDEWKLLAAKARKWLDDTEAVPAGRGAWLDAAAEFLRL